MDFKGQAPSTNFEDRTGWGSQRRNLNTVTTLLNPVSAARKLQDWLQAKGYAPIHAEVDFRPGIIDILSKGS